MLVEIDVDTESEFQLVDLLKLRNAVDLV